MKVVSDVNFIATLNFYCNEEKKVVFSYRNA